MSAMPIPSHANLDRAIKVRVVEELLIDAQDPVAPGVAWVQRQQRDGQASVVGLLSVVAQPPVDPANPKITATTPTLRFLTIVDRAEALAPLRHPALLGMCDGGGMVFLEASLGELPRRWVVYPMDASGVVVS